MLAAALAGCGDEVVAVAHERVEPPRPRAAELDDYPWIAERGGAPLEGWPALESLFDPPEGLSAEPVAGGTFGAWLGGLPVDPARTTPHTSRGMPTLSPSAGIIVLDVGEKDLQQCADSILRLHAEWAWSRGGSARQAIAYHFTSGHRASWADWTAGREWQVRGSEVIRAKGSPRTPSRQQFRLYLEQVFIYAGTRSLPADTRELTAAEAPEAGDILVNPGSPGHAVLLLRTARGDDGDLYALLGEGWMPAQEFHVVRDRLRDRVWMPLPTANQDLTIPGVATFDADSVRRFALPE
jgi:hypothetical protein